MSDYQRHTEFLRECIFFDESHKRQELVEQISQMQRDIRCVQRAVWLMAMITLLVGVGLSYGVILADNFPYNVPQFIMNVICGVGMVSLISLLAFMGLGMVYRTKLDKRREECRQLVTRLLESHLGRPVATPLPDNHASQADARVLQGPDCSMSRGLPG